jgi:hypothetical protein
MIAIASCAGDAIQYQSSTPWAGDMTKAFLERLNGPQHETALRLFVVIVLAHWAEHLLQALQIYVLGWPVPEARGALGYFFPFLVSSEIMHYGYALVMLVGLWILRPGFTGHFLLQTQALSGHYLFDRPVPTSIVQLWVPRVELHLFYNTIVFIPMVVAMYYHMFPPVESGRAMCTCAWHRRVAASV